MNRRRLAIGVALGAAFGEGLAAAFHAPALLAVGVGVGVALGTAWARRPR
jgi:hypothetical protein